VSAISINRLPQSYPFMETVRPETLQAQGWEKWFPESHLQGDKLSKIVFQTGIVGFFRLT
jgi:hypothetical protein